MHEQAVSERLTIHKLNRTKTVNIQTPDLCCRYEWNHRSAGFWQQDLSLSIWASRHSAWDNIKPFPVLTQYFTCPYQNFASNFINLQGKYSNIHLLPKHSSSQTKCIYNSASVLLQMNKRSCSLWIVNIFKMFLRNTIMQITI